MKSNSSSSEALYKAILSLKTLDEAKRFFRDLLTEEEIEEFSKRWQAARLLNEAASYVTIQKETGLSSTTVARISRWLQTGAGGYRLVLDRQSSIAHHIPLSRGRD
ncbi:TrpR-like protein, YerC/YecD [Patescibacteria group bacterium]|nr:TrpR-like protein, YerC/YecD [Patescibacteria group bacterium]MBP9709957.1 TrpR-like protein, YerC/YecD [Patescibacteria group bacterium]